MISEFYNVIVLRNAMIYSFMDISLRTSQTFIISKERNDIRPILKHLEELKSQIGFGNIEFDYLFLHRLIEGRKYYEGCNSSTILESTRQTLNSILACEEIFGDEYYMQQLDLKKMLGYGAYGWTIDNVKTIFSLFSTKPQVDSIVSNSDLEKWIKYSQECVTAIGKLYFCLIGRTNNPKYINKNSIAPRYVFSKRYNLSCINDSPMRLSEKIMLKAYKRLTGEDYNNVLAKIQKGGFDLKDFIPDFHKEISPEFSELINAISLNEKPNICVDFSLIPLKFGNGGVHGCKPGKYESGNGRSIISFDIHSMYATVACKYNIRPRQFKKEFTTILLELLTERISLIKEGKENTGECEFLKKILNCVYGKTQEEKSILYDKAYSAHLIIVCQLFMCLWLTKLLDIENIDVLLVNTDGMIIAVDDDKISTVREIAKSMKDMINGCVNMSFFNRIYIKDVNNYVAVKKDTEICAKGIFDAIRDIYKNNSAIAIKKIVCNYLLYNMSPEESVKRCDNIDFVIYDNYKDIVTYKGLDFEKNINGIISYIICSNPKTSGIIINSRGKKLNSGGAIKILETKSDIVDIDYSYYITEANKILLFFNEQQLKLF